MNILITTQLPQEGFSILDGHNLIFPQSPKFSQEEFMSLIPEADILVSTFDYKVSAEAISKAGRLKMIANFGVGFNNIDLEAAKERGIMVTNTPDPVIEPTAEHAFTLMLAIAHRTAELDRKMRESESRIEFGVMNNLGIAIYGKTLGIVGMGNIGQSLAKRAVACGMRIIYHNRHRLPKEKEALCAAEYVDMETLLKESDFVSLNMPYTPETHHLINNATLSLMKQGSVLINTARGACVKESDLIEHLKNGHLYGAALDVYEFEPKVSDRLKELDNVVMSPHIGTGTIDGRMAMCRCCSDNIQWFLNGDIEKMNRVG